MSKEAKKKNQSARADSTVPRLFVLELNAGRIHSMNTDGSDRKTVVTDCHLPDGIAVDVDAGHIYWTNMGVPNLNDGSIERADIDIGAIARACVSCAAILTARSWRHLSRPAAANPIAEIRRGGVSG